MREYLRYRCWDFLLCVLMSIGFSVNMLSGFNVDYIPEMLPQLIILVIIFSVICFLAAINKITSIVGILAAAAGFVALLFMARANALFTNDAENSTQIFLVIIIIVTVGVFLMARGMIALFILLLLGNLLQAGAAFLQFPTFAWAYALFLFAGGMMVFYRVYVKSVFQASTGKVKFKGFMIQNVLVCLVAIVLATGIFAGIVRPLNPPTRELKLIERLLSFEVLERIGVSTVKIQVNRDLTSDIEPEEQLATDQLNEEEDDGNTQEQEELQQEEQEDAGNLQDTQSDITEDANAITYEKPNLWFIWIIVAAAAVVFLIWLRKYMRKKWLEKLDAMSREDAIYNLFNYFMFGMRLAKCKKADNLTLPEYVKLNDKELAKYDSENVTFARIAEIYQKAYYGRRSVTDAEYAEYLEYYHAFHKNLINSIGRFKYIFLYFRV